MPDPPPRREGRSERTGRERLGRPALLSPSLEGRRAGRYSRFVKRPASRQMSRMLRLVPTAAGKAAAREGHRASVAGRANAPPTGRRASRDRHPPQIGCRRGTAALPDQPQTPSSSEPRRAGSRAEGAPPPKLPNGRREMTSRDRRDDDHARDTAVGGAESVDGREGEQVGGALAEAAGLLQIVDLARPCLDSVVIPSKLSCFAGSR